jgi:hypothetical protein
VPVLDNGVLMAIIAQGMIGLSLLWDKILLQARDPEPYFLCLLDGLDEHFRRNSGLFRIPLAAPRHRAFGFRQRSIANSPVSISTTSRSSAARLLKPWPSWAVSLQ